MKRFGLLILVLIVTLAGSAMAGKPAPNPGLIIDYALVDANGIAYSVRPSDGKGALIDGVDCTSAVLELGGFNVYTNQCGKNAAPLRLMEVNMASPAQGQNPIADYMGLASFHTTAPGIASMATVGDMLDVDLAVAINVGTNPAKTISYKIRYGENGTPLALVTCVATSNNQCTQWTITPGGGTDLAEVFDTNGNNYGWFHMPFYLTITRK